MKTSTILINALNIIDTPGMWTKDAKARTADGVVVHPSCPAAVSFCSIGALEKVSNDSMFAIHLLRITADEIDSDSDIVSVNDSSRSPFSKKMNKMWLGAIFTALAIES